MRILPVVYSATLLVLLGMNSVYAQSAPGQTVNVTPNQQTTQATAVSNPSGQNISQQNNFYDPSANAFGPGISCSGPYLASSVYRDDSSSPGSIGTGSFANTGGTIGIVIPINGTNKKCQEFVNEIVFQRQIDTCLSMAKQGFSFDPNGQYALLAKRCTGIRFTGQPISSANPLSPPPPPTVITVPATPLSTGPLPGSPVIHAEAPPQTLAAPAAPAQVADVPHPKPQIPVSSTCQALDPKKKVALLALLREPSANRQAALERLHAACVTDAEIVSKL
jgi:hypothetical protein